MDRNKFFKILGTTIRILIVRFILIIGLVVYASWGFYQVHGMLYGILLNLFVILCFIIPWNNLRSPLNLSLNIHKIQRDEFMYYIAKNNKD